MSVKHILQGYKMFSQLETFFMVYLYIYILGNIPPKDIFIFSLTVIFVFLFLISYLTDKYIQNFHSKVLSHIFKYQPRCALLIANNYFIFLILEWLF